MKFIAAFRIPIRRIDELTYVSLEDNIYEVEGLTPLEPFSEFLICMSISDIHQAYMTTLFYYDKNDKKVEVKFWELEDDRNSPYRLFIPRRAGFLKDLDMASSHWFISKEPSFDKWEDALTPDDLPF